MSLAHDTTNMFENDPFVPVGAATIAVLRPFFMMLCCSILKTMVDVILFLGVKL
jgi:hypothetical protein